MVFQCNITNINKASEETKNYTDRDLPIIDEIVHQENEEVTETLNTKIKAKKLKTKVNKADFISKGCKEKLFSKTTPLKECFEADNKKEDQADKQIIIESLNINEYDVVNIVDAKENTSNTNQEEVKINKATTFDTPIVQKLEEYEMPIIYDFYNVDHEEQFIKILHSKDTMVNQKAISAFINEYMKEARSITITFVSKLKVPKILYTPTDSVQDSMKINILTIIDKTNEGVDSLYLQQLFDELNFEKIISLNLSELKSQSLVKIFKGNAKFLKSVLALSIESIRGKFKPTNLMSIKINDLRSLRLDNKSSSLLFDPIEVYSNLKNLKFIYLDKEDKKLEKKIVKCFSQKLNISFRG